MHDPITLLGGAILDGRNRYRACLKAGVAPKTEPFTGRDPVREDGVKWSELNAAG